MLDEVALVDAGLVVDQVPAVGQIETSRARSVHLIAFDLKHIKMSHHTERLHHLKIEFTHLTKKVSINYD